MAETEMDYLARRAAQEFDYADQCHDPISASIHRRMAMLYGEKIVELHQLTAREIAEQRAIPQPSTSAL